MSVLHSTIVSKFIAVHQRFFFIYGPCTNFRESMDPLTFFRAHVSMAIGGSSWHYPGADLQYTHCVALILLHGFPVDTKASSTMGSWLALRQGQLERVGVRQDHGVNLSPIGGGSRGLNLVFFFSMVGWLETQVLQHFRRQLCYMENVFAHWGGHLHSAPYIGISCFLLSLTAPLVIVLSEKVKPRAPSLRQLFMLPRNQDWLETACPQNGFSSWTTPLWDSNGNQISGYKLIAIILCI